MSRIAPKRRIFLVAPALLLAGMLLPAGRALALDGAGFSMEVLVDGRPLAEYAARGTRYIEALKGREYSVRLRNNTGGRVAVALSVDGLNSIDARTTTAGDARKWILDPYETVTLDGWQTSGSTARRFIFTTEQRSYGSWLGKTQNLGVIAAAVFRERVHPVLYDQMQYPKDQAGGPEGRNRAHASPEPQSESAAPGAAGSGAAGPGATAPAPAPGERGMTDAAPGQKKEIASPGRKPSDNLAATGIGRQVDHVVTQIWFDAEDTPAVQLQVRYEYRDALVRLGVLPQDLCCDSPLSRRETARGFQDGGFAPDPYRPRQR